MIADALLTFLAGIAKHNHREWYDLHKEEYKSLRADFTQLMEELGDAVAVFDPAVAKAKKQGKPITKVFRIHRDARFARGKTKYKTNISGLIAADVKNDAEPAYYLSIEPGGKSFVGGGLFMPERLVLSEIRDQIETKPKALKKLETTPAFQAAFPHGLSRERTLKTAPRGHDPEHEAIEYLRLKSFTAGKNLPDSALKSTDCKQQILQDFQALYPVQAFLRVKLPAKANQILTQF